MNEDSTPHAGLRRTLGTGDVVAFLLVTVIGTRWIASAAAIGPGALVLWLIAGAALFLPLAFTVLELSSRYPGEGGIYVWCREAFGERAAFHAAWLYWASNLTYFPGLLYFTAANALFVTGHGSSALSASPIYYIIASLVGLAIALVPNLLGMRFGKWLHNAGAVGTWVPIALVVAMGCVAWSRFGAATSFSASAFVPSLRLETLVFVSTVAFAFAGFETASFLGDEIRDPRRALPRAILISAVAIAAVYLLGTLALLVALPAHEVSSLQGIMQAIERTASRVGWPGVAVFAALLLAIGNVGGVGAWLAATARLPLVAGMDGRLPPAFARVHPRWGTPVTALLVQAAGSVAFILLSQAGASVQVAYEVLTSMTVIAYFIPYVLMFAALVRLQRVPVGAEVRRAPGSAKLWGVLGLLTTVLSIGLALIPPAGEAWPWLSVTKVVGGSLVLVSMGEWLFRAGERRVDDLKSARSVPH